MGNNECAFDTTCPPLSPGDTASKFEDEEFAALFSDALFPMAAESVPPTPPPAEEEEEEEEEEEAPGAEPGARRRARVPPEVPSNYKEESKMLHCFFPEEVSREKYNNLFSNHPKYNVFKISIL